MAKEGHNLYERAAAYHRALPDRIRMYLNGRGISDASIDLHLLGWNGKRITIPVPDRAGDLAFFKLAKDPKDRTSSPKMLATRGSRVELYGWEEVGRSPHYVILCEGEFDRFVLESQGFIAVTSTGGAGTFRREWAEEFLKIPYVFICFDRDEAGRRGALKIGRLIPHAKVVTLPPEVGEGGDVTDFFARLGCTREEFIRLLGEATPVPLSEPVIRMRRPVRRSLNSSLQQRIERIKAEIALDGIVGRSVKLRASGDHFVGLCPFHSETDPSFVVYPESGAFHCFGCGRHGDVIDFVKENEHITFGQALDILDSLRAYHGNSILDN